jgi:Flp pilus assembly protein TadD
MGLLEKDSDAADFYMIGTGFGKVGNNLKKAIEFLNIAVELNPKKELYYEDLGVAYGMDGQYDMAIATSKKLIQLNANYAPAYNNLAISYGHKGDNKLADKYSKKYDELINAK